MKSDFRSESFERKIQHNSFCQLDNLMIGCSIKNGEEILKRLLNKGIQKLGIKFNLV